MIGIRRATALENSCTCRLCMFSPRCEPISTRQSVFSMSVGSGEPRPLPKVSDEADVARAAALRERGAGHVDAAVALQHVLDEAHADAVVEHGDRFRPVRALDLLHAVGDVRQRLVPGRRLPRFLAAFAGPDQRRAQAVRVVDRRRARRCRAGTAVRGSAGRSDCPRTSTPCRRAPRRCRRSARSTSRRRSRTVLTSPVERRRGRGG